MQIILIYLNESAQKRGPFGDYLHGQQIIFHFNLILRDLFTYLLPKAQCDQSYITFSSSLCLSGQRKCSQFMNHHRPVFLTASIVAKPSL